MPYPYLTEQQSLARRRAMAQALQQQSFEPIEAPNYPGAQTSPWQGVAKMVQALMAGVANRRLDQQQLGLESKIKGERGAMVQALLGSPSTTQYQDVSTPGGTSQVSLPPNTPAMASAFASGDPVLQQIAAAITSGGAKQEEEKRARQFELEKMQYGHQLNAPLTQAQISHLGAETTALGRPKYINVPQGGAVFDEQTGQSPFVNPAKVTTPPVDQQELTDYLKKNPGKGPADFAGYKATLGQRPQRQVLWGDDPNNPGKQIPFEYDENTRALTPIAIQRTPTAQLNAIANEDKAYDEAMNSVAAMEGLAKRKTYAGDQAMADQFFNVVKPGSGARMNQAQIERFMTPGPIKSKMQVWAQKLDQGQPLDDVARADLVESARIVAQSKKPKAKAPAANDLPTVGGTFNGAKVLKVTPWPN